MRRMINGITMHKCEFTKTLECVVGLLHTRMCHSESVLYAQTENVKFGKYMRQALRHAFYILACFEQFKVIHRLASSYETDSSILEPILVR